MRRTPAARLHRAAERSRRRRFARRVARELTRLQRDPVAWAAYLAGAEATTVGDGLE